MRNAFADEILKIALEDERIVVLSGDIGNRLFDKFKAAMPDRFHNCGVAEANMISLAAGLASSGLRPVCYTITPFVTTRCLEQIKLDVCYHNMPVTIVGTGSGLSYAALGSTHHSFEDLAIMRNLPGMHVLAPADAPELRAAMRWVFGQSQPAYLRIGKKGESVLTPESTFAAGRWQLFRSGSDVSILACGTILGEALEAAGILANAGIQAAVWNCASVKPLDFQVLRGLCGDVVFSIEEHSVLGGFGSAVAEFLSAQKNPPRLIRLGIPDEFLHDCGEQEEARSLCGLDAASLARRIADELK
ncbi:MAG: transketolase [Verrucomicrobia bacterium]|nr:transketolase [Verrucomicrobiota bacterium]